MHEYDLPQQLSQVAKTKPINLPRIPRYKTADIQEQHKTFNDQQCQYLIFKVPNYQIKRTQIIINYRYCFDGSKRKLLSMQSKKQLKKRIKSKQTKTHEQKCKNKQLTLENIDEIKKKKSQIIKKYQVNSNRTPHKIKYSSNKNYQILLTKKRSNSKEEIGFVVKNQIKPSHNYDKNMSGIQHNIGTISNNQRFSSQHRHEYAKAQYADWKKIAFSNRYVPLQKYSHKIQQHNYSRRLSSSKKCYQQLSSQRLKKNFTQSIEKQTKYNQEISTIDPWQTQIVVDL